MNKILWVDDDYFHIQSLLRQVEKKGYKIDYALNAADGFVKAKNWKEYKIIIVDIILPLSNHNEKLSDTVKSWELEDYPGVGFLKWLLLELKVKIPVVVLSVIEDLLDKYELQGLGVAEVITKTGQGPSQIAERLNQYLKSKGE